MNYFRIYDAIVKRASLRESSEYTELHHILPKCLGGSDNKDNLVSLTAREHFIAHQLLVKIYPENDKLIYAAHLMTIGGKNHVRNNKHYEWLRIKHSKNMSKLHKGKYVTEETREKMSLAKKGLCVGEKNNFFNKTHTEEFKNKKSEQMKLAQKGANNSNAKSWKIRFPDGSINTITCLKEFCKEIGISVYKIRNNKANDYVLLEKM
jgi:hypothetical protein